MKNEMWNDLLGLAGLKSNSRLSPAWNLICEQVIVHWIPGCMTQEDDKKKCRQSCWLKRTQWLLLLDILGAFQTEEVDNLQ